MKKLTFIIIAILLLSSCSTMNNDVVSVEEETYTPAFIPVETIEETPAIAEEPKQEEIINEEVIVEENIIEAEELPLAQIEEELEEVIIEILSLDKEYVKFQYPSNLSLEYSPEENEKLYLAELNEVPPSDFDYISIKTYLANDVISNSLFKTQLNELSSVEIRDIVEEERARLAQNPSYLSLIGYDTLHISNLFTIYYIYELNEDGQSVIVENYYIQNEDVIHEIIVSYRAEKEANWKENANLVLSSIEFLYPVEEEIIEVIEAIEQAPIEKEIAKEEVKVEPVKKESPKPVDIQTIAPNAKASDGLDLWRIISLAVGAIVLLFGIIFLVSRLRKNKKSDVKIDE